MNQKGRREESVKIFHAKSLPPKRFFHPASNCTCRRDTNGYGRGRACSAADRIRELRLTIEALRKELNAKEKQMATMQEQLNYFQKKLFGTSSEKHSLAIEGQLGLFDEVESEAAKETVPEPDAEEEPAASPRPRRPRTRKEELLRGIPVTEKIVDLPEAEKICPKCGAELQPAGRKFLRDEIHFVPAKVTVTRI